MVGTTVFCVRRQNAFQTAGLFVTKFLLFVFSFVLLFVGWSAFRMSGIVPQTTIKWRWFADHSVNLSMDYRIMLIGFLIALPILLWLFGKRS
jgi:hypothetical protein